MIIDIPGYAGESATAILGAITMIWIVLGIIAVAAMLQKPEMDAIIGFWDLGWFWFGIVLSRKWMWHSSGSERLQLRGQTGTLDRIEGFAKRQRRTFELSEIDNVRVLSAAHGRGGDSLSFTLLFDSAGKSFGVGTGLSEVDIVALKNCLVRSSVAPCKPT